MNDKLANVIKLCYELLQKHQADNIIEVRFLLMTISLSFTTFFKFSMISIQILITLVWVPNVFSCSLQTSATILVLDLLSCGLAASCQSKCQLSTLQISPISCTVNFEFQHFALNISPLCTVWN